MKMRKLLIPIIALVAILATAGWVLFWRYVADKIDDSIFEQTPTLADEHQEWYRGISEASWDQYSEPRDPWSLKAPPHQGTLLVIPLLDEEGRTGDVGDTLQNMLHFPWRFYMPAGVGVIDMGRTRGNLKSLLAYEGGRPDRLVTDEAVERFVKFTGATHVITGRWETDDNNDTMMVELTLTTPAGESSAQFQGKPSEELYLGAEITGWVLENAGFEIEPRIAELMRNPFFGPAFGAFEDELLAGLLEDAAHPEWSAVIAAHPDVPSLPFIQANVAYRKGDLATAQGREVPPLGLDADPWERLTRATWLLARKDFVRAAHESELLAAQRPENLWAWVRFYFDAVPDSMRRKTYMESAEKWFARVKPTPMIYAYMGNVHVDVAWEYRGTSFWSEVGPVGKELHPKYIESGGDLLSRALREAGVIPWVAERYIATLGGGSGSNLGVALHRQVIAEFPDNSETWGTTLNYLRPRWSGSRSAGEDLIDELLAHETKVPEIFRQVWTYHAGEAGLAKRDSEVWHNRTSSYLEENPRATAQLEKAIDRLLACEPKERSHAIALMIASDMKSWPLSFKIVSSLPVSYVPLRHHINDTYEGLTISRSLFCLYWIGEFEVMKSSLEEALARDEELRRSGNSNPSLYVINVDDTRDFLRGLSLMMNGEVEEGYELTRPALEDSKDDWWSTVLPAHLFHGKVDDGTLVRVEKLIAKDSEKQNPHLMKALALAHLDRMEEAREAWQVAMDKEGSELMWLRREAARLLEMPLE